MVYNFSIPQRKFAENRKWSLFVISEHLPKGVFRKKEKRHEEDKVG